MDGSAKKLANKGSRDTNIQHCTRCIPTHAFRVTVFYENNVYRCTLYVSIPTTLVCLLFGTAIPIYLFFSMLVTFLYTCTCTPVSSLLENSAVEGCGHEFQQSV